MLLQAGSNDGRSSSNADGTVKPDGTVKSDGELRLYLRDRVRAVEMMIMKV